MIITVESLDKLFEHNIHAKPLRYEGRCHHCGNHLEVEIAKTAGGYGFLGGVLYESKPPEFLLLCCDCFKKTTNQIDKQDY